MGPCSDQFPWLPMSCHSSGCDVYQSSEMDVSCDEKKAKTVSCVMFSRKKLRMTQPARKCEREKHLIYLSLFPSFFSPARVLACLKQLMMTQCTFGEKLITLIFPLSFFSLEEAEGQKKTKLGTATTSHNRDRGGTRRASEEIARFQLFEIIWNENRFLVLHSYLLFLLFSFSLFSEAFIHSSSYKPFLLLFCFSFSPFFAFSLPFKKFSFSLSFSACWRLSFAAGWLLPDRPFYSFRDLQSGDRRILCVSETSWGGLSSFKVDKDL